MSPLERLAGPGAALLWFLFCVRWFDAAEPFRPPWLAALSPAAAAWLAALSIAGWLGVRRACWLAPLPGGARGMLFVVALAVAFRLPLAWWGAWGYTTADASLSGIVALQARDGIAHHVFVPSVAYSGSLKSHLAALLSAASGIDIVRAFVLASLGFYALFVAAAYRLGALLDGPGTALLAGLYAAFAPTFVTWYSLSNDGNYVEVLALGSWALLLSTRLGEAGPGAGSVAAAIGVLLGLGFWCHILAITHAAAILVIGLLALRARALRAFGAMALGFASGDLPGLLWNAGHGWDSFRYLVPGGHWDAAREVEAAGAGAPHPGLLERLWLALVDHGPTLFGYDAGYPAAVDALSRGLAWLGLLAFLGALSWAARRALAARRLEVCGVLLVFAAVNLAAALVALPHVAGNPRYLLFLFAPASVLLAGWLWAGKRRLVLALLIGFGAFGSWGQARAKLADSGAWRGFVAELRQAGVRFCYTDYYLAARIDFFGELDPLCSSKLGPITTEYFLEFRERVDRAAAVDIVAINAFSAARIERKLDELGVDYERRDLLKPVLLRLSRKVDPRELFPGRDFRPR